MIILCNLAERHTKKALTETIEFNGTPYQAADFYKKNDWFGFKDDCVYVDYCVLEYDNDYQRTIF